MNSTFGRLIRQMVSANPNVTDVEVLRYVRDHGFKVTSVSYAVNFYKDTLRMIKEEKEAKNAEANTEGLPGRPGQVVEP